MKAKNTQIDKSQFDSQPQGASLDKRDKLALIEEALLDSVSGGVCDEGVCSGHQFCEYEPPREPGS